MKRNSRTTKATWILAMGALVGGVVLWASNVSNASGEERAVEAREARAMGHIAARTLADVFPMGR